MAGRTVVITGGNSGLGFAAAREVVRRGDVVVLGCRRPEAAADARAALADETAAERVLVLPLDLADLSSVARAAAELRRLAPGGVDALICNAGIQLIDPAPPTTAGLDPTFAANHLGHFALARAVLPSLKASGRIVFVASNTHDPREWTGMPAPSLEDVDRVARGAAFGNSPAEGRRRYTTSKLYNVLTAYELERRLRASGDAARGIDVVAFDPGLMPGTGLARDYGPVARMAWRCFGPLLLVAPNVNRVVTSARRLVSVALREDPSIQGGTYVSRGRRWPSADASHDAALARKLWSSSSILAGLGDDLLEARS